MSRHQAEKKKIESEMYQIEERLEDLDKEIAESELREEEEGRRIDEQCRKELQERVQKVREGGRNVLQDQIANMGDRYTSQTEDFIGNKQVDILRVNKAFREVSRHMGADWKPILMYMMGGLEPQVKEATICTVEKQRPFMQPYKALTMWKDLRGESFNILRLVDACKVCERMDLAEITLDILESKGDTLYSLSSVGSGIVPGSEDGAGGAAAPSSYAGGATRPDGAAGASDASRLSRSYSIDDSTELVIDGKSGDRLFLKIAKKLDRDWVPLGQALGLNEEEMNEIVGGEGNTYQGAFKMLWTWRDNVHELAQDNIAVLANALRSVGKQNLADEFLKKSPGGGGGGGGSGGYSSSSTSSSVISSSSNTSSVSRPPPPPVASKPVQVVVNPAVPSKPRAPLAPAVASKPAAPVAITPVASTPVTVRPANVGNPPVASKPLPSYAASTVASANNAGKSPGTTRQNGNTPAAGAPSRQNGGTPGRPAKPTGYSKR